MSTTFTKHPDYNTDKFPTFVGYHGNWFIYMNERGYSAAIPTEEAAKNGCKASHFGGFYYTLAALSADERKAVLNHPRILLRLIEA